MANAQNNLEEPLVWSEYDRSDLVSIDSKNGVDNHKDRRNGTNTVFGAVTTFVSIAMGAGILSVPGAMRSSGWIGVGVIMCVASLAHFTSLLLIKCLHMVPGKRCYSYEELGEAVWGANGRFLVSIYQSVTLFGVATIFLILIGGNLVQLLKNQPTVQHFTDHLWLILVGVIVLPLTWLRKLTDIKWLSTLGVVSSSSVAVIVAVTSIIQGSKHPAVHESFTDRSGVIECINIVLFSFCVHSFIPAIETSMAEPEKWPQVSALAFTFVALINITVSSAGYYGFGTAITGNVLATPGLNPTVATVALILITVAVIAQYPLPLNPVSTFFEELFGIVVEEEGEDREDSVAGYAPIETEGDRPLDPGENRLCNCSMQAKSIILRSVLVLVTVVIGCLVPYFAQVLALLGSLVLVGPALTFPQVFYVILKRRRNEHISVIMYIVIALSLCVAAFATVMGTYVGVEQLLDQTRLHPDPFKNFFWNPNVTAT